MPRSIRKHLILATLATVLGLAGCDSTSSSSSSALVNFSTTPTGWMKTTDYKMSSTITADVFLTSVSVTGYPPNAAIVTSPTSGLPVDSAAKLELQTMQLESSNFSLDSSKSIKVQGQSAWLLQYRVTEGGYSLLMREILFVYKSKDCQILFARLQNDSTSANATTLRTLESKIVLN